MLKSRLDASGVDYEVCDDIEKMKSLGIMSVPVLGVDDELLGFTDAIQKISQLS
jgi:phage gp45-like